MQNDQEDNRRYAMSGVKHVPDRVVVGPYGHCIEPGYTEIGGVRLYPERIVIGPNGPVLSAGRAALSPNPTGGDDR